MLAQKSIRKPKILFSVQKFKHTFFCRFVKYEISGHRSINRKNHNNHTCIPITFNNPLTTCFLNKKYILQSKQTRDKL